MNASLLDLVDRTAPRLPAHATVGEALATCAVEPDDHVVVLDGEVFLGLVRGRDLIDHLHDRAGVRDLAHVCELLDDVHPVVDLGVDPALLHEHLVQTGVTVAAVLDDDRFVGVVVLDDLRQSLPAS